MLRSFSIPVEDNYSATCLTSVRMYLKDNEQLLLFKMDEI